MKKSRGLSLCFSDTYAKALRKGFGVDAQKQTNILALMRPGLKALMRCG